MSSRPRVLRASLVVAASALALSACSDGGNAGGTTAASDTTPAAQPTPSTTVKVPADTVVTPPGTRLDFGATATVPHEVRDDGTVLGLTVESATQGSLDDFVGFDLDDPYKKRGSYYYVQVLVENAGKADLGGVPVPLWGISGEGTLLQAVEFKSAFKKCPTQPLPDRFAPRDTFKTCLVFLSPDHGTLDGVSYRPTEDYAPIEWHGKVKMLPAKKPAKGEKPAKGDNTQGNG